MKRIILSILGASLFFGSNAQSNLNVESSATYLKYRSGKFYTVENPNERGKYRIKGQELKDILIETDAYDSYKMHKTFKALNYTFGGLSVETSINAKINNINTKVVFHFVQAMVRE